MQKHKLQPFSEEEKLFAECNHNLIYSYLRSNGYSIEEFYIIAAEGYLKAVQVYHIKEEVQSNYDFAFIAYQYMRAEINNHSKGTKARKRIPLDKVTSLDVEFDDMDSLYNTVGSKSTELNVMEKIMIQSIIENLSEIQRNILLLKIEGYNNKELYTQLGLKQSIFYREMHTIKGVIEEVLAG